MSTREWLALIALSIIWGGSFFFIEVALDDFPAFTIVALRVMLAALVLWSVVLIFGLKVPNLPKLWLAFLIMGLLNNALPFGLITWGQTQITASFASILNTAMPFFTVIVAGLLLPDEKISPLKILGVLIGFIGVFAMINFPQFDTHGQIWAQFAILGGGLSYAFACVYGRRFQLMHIHPIVLAAGQTSAASLFMLPVALGVDGVPNISHVSMASLASIIALGVLSTATAYVLYFKILASSGAVNLSLVTLLIPVSAIFLGIVVLGERLTLIHVIGMGLITLGLSVIDGRLWRRNH